MNLQRILFPFFLLAFPASGSAGPCLLWESVHYESGAVALTLEQKQRIDRIFQRAPSVDGIEVLLVIGHADGREGSVKNQASLAFERANAVQDYILRSWPEYRGRVFAESFGASRMSTLLGSPLNRRTDIEATCRMSDVIIQPAIPKSR